jgi:hypothetical protein
MVSETVIYGSTEILMAKAGKAEGFIWLLHYPHVSLIRSFITHYHNILSQGQD